MKKLSLLLLCVFAFQFTTLSAFTPASTRIPFTTQKIDKSKLGPGASRTPVQPPVVYLDGYTLTFESHADFTLQVVSFDDESVVFETSVPSSVSEVQLPSYLTGEYELRLYTDSFLFAGYIDL